MSNENQGNPYKQRFKGIENFLRRVAFNLGNTPSQTEVKIISCIPIDVTDLQQKIVSLEKELNEARAANDYKSNIVMNTSITRNTPTRHSTPIVQTALAKPTPIGAKSKNTLQCKCSQSKVPVAHHACCTKSSTNQGSSKRKKCSLCFISPHSSDNKYQDTYINSNLNERKAAGNRDRASKIGSKIVPNRLKRVLKKKTRQKTQLVYFAQTSNTPFNSYDITSESVKRMSKNKNVISRSYLNNVIRKQYEPELIVDELTDISQFSSPVCRDVNWNRNNDSYESNLSCCYGKYENLDKCWPRKNQNLNIAANNSLIVDPGPVTIHYQCNNQTNCNGYYDSNHYDLYPVKEKPVKLKKEELVPKHIKRANIEWSENFRNKNNLQSLWLNFNENSNNAFDYNHEINKIFESDSREKEYTFFNARRKINRNDEDQGINVRHPLMPKVCSVDYGDVYVKRNLAVSGIEKATKKTPSLKNVACLTVNTNNTQCQTVESKAVQLNIPSDNKADVTLNQIKSILQSVLAEVRTNIKSKNVQCKTKKDALIQKDMSHNNIAGGSTLLNSFTYNPSYNVNPCLASYSRHIPNLCYANLPSLPIKSMQNCPTIIPPVKRLSCGCQHKDINNTEKPQPQTKTAITAATNTDMKPRTATKTETVNLIREIYKSIAQNVNYSNKNTSHILFENQIAFEHPENKSDITNAVTSTEHQSTDRQDTKLDDPTVVFTSNTTNENTESIVESTQSVERTESEETTTLKDSQISENYVEEDKEYNASEQHENETNDIITHNEDQTTNSSDEGESEDTLVAENTNKKEKPGLIQKVLQTVNIFKKNKQKIVKGGMGDDSEIEQSDSDYQTIYSYKSYRDLKQPIARKTQKPSKREHLKSIVQTNRELKASVQENPRRSPYMEQEYRRYWDEKLMFHEKISPMHSSERSFPGRTRSPGSPVFWRGYEARSAILRNRQTNIQLEQSKLSQAVPKERTGLKLEWLKKQKVRKSVQEEK